MHIITLPNPFAFWTNNSSEIVGWEEETDEREGKIKGKEENGKKGEIEDERSCEEQKERGEREEDQECEEQWRGIRSQEEKEAEK
jgi:hypothetical protein